MKKVLVWGTFDVLHLGHLDFLSKAKSHGDNLVVLIGRDKVVEKIKGKKPLHDEQERLQMILALKPVDEAYLDRVEEDFLMVKKIAPDVICLGYDQMAFTDQLPGMLAKFGLKPEIIRLEPHGADRYKSTKIKENLMKK